MTRPPVAATLQLGAGEEDGQLTIAARARRPGVRWWWGVRKWLLEGSWQTGAWCYLCDDSIATWSGRWPVTEQAKCKIAMHRTLHVQGRLDTPHTAEEAQS